MPSFDDLKDVYIIFIQQMRYKNSHKSSFEQTLKIFNCEEKVSYPYYFCSRTAVNPNSAYKQLSLFKYKLKVLDKNVVTTLSGSSI